ncbi:MAG: hypothetical protein AAF998_05705 [Bacteroidota bacterium]
MTGAYLAEKNYRYHLVNYLGERHYAENLAVVHVSVQRFFVKYIFGSLRRTMVIQVLLGELRAQEPEIDALLSAEDTSEFFVMYTGEQIARSAIDHLVALRAAEDDWAIQAQISALRAYCVAFWAGPVAVREGDRTIVRTPDGHREEFRTVESDFAPEVFRIKIDRRTAL